jgi:hypothetical protein
MNFTVRLQSKMDISKNRRFFKQNTILPLAL